MSEHLAGQLDLLNASAASQPAPSESPARAAPSVRRERPDFWRDNAGAVVIERQPRICVYTNQAGAVVVRQESDDCDDDSDAFVYIRPENVQAVVAALLAERDGRR